MIKKKKSMSRDFSGSPGVKTLQASNAGGLRFPSLVLMGKLRSHVPQAEPEKNNRLSVGTASMEK